MDKEKAFISYTTRTDYDVKWALWLDSVLKYIFSYETIIQEFDSVTGGNFKAFMDDALKEASIVIGVVTESYLESANCREEWTNAERFIPVLFDEYKPRGLLKSRVYIDLYGKSEEDAIKALQYGLTKKERPTGVLPYPEWKSGRDGNQNKLSYPAFRTHAVHNLEGRNPNFSGREDMLENIRKEFTRYSIVELMGQGGFGKTQIAVEYAYRHIYDYDYIWIFNGESAARLENAYREFAFQVMKLEQEKELAFTDIKTMIGKWLIQQNSYLLIYDNAEGCPELYDFMLQGHEGHILITTREKLYHIKNMRRLDIEVFTPEDALTFLTIRLGDSVTDELKQQLAQALGYLPLALEQAVAYMKETYCSSEKYLELLEQHGLRIFNKEPSRVDYENTVLTSWKITYDKMEQDNSLKNAVIFYKILAYCEPDYIPLEMFIKGREGLPSPLKEIMQPINKLDQDELILTLRNYSLLLPPMPQQDKSLLSIHRLMQEAVQFFIEDDQRFLHYCFTVAVDACGFDYGTSEDRDYFLAAYPHMAHIAEQIDNLGLEQEDQKNVALIYYHIGLGLYQQGDYPTALEYFQKSLAIYQKVLGTEHSSTTSCYIAIAGVYFYQGDYPTALEYYQKALTINEKVLGREHPDVACSFLGIANVYANQGDYPKALEYFQKALEIYVKVQGTEHPDTANTYNNMANLYYLQEDYPKALEYYQKALEINVKVQGTEHPATAVTYINMGKVYSDQGDYSIALEYTQMALAISEKVLGTEHPDTATTYNNMSNVYKAQGDYPKALEYHQKALEIREKVLGTEHPDTASTCINMGNVYRAKGDYPKALEYYQKALPTLEKVLGVNHPTTQNVRNNLMICKRTDRSRIKRAFRWLNRMIKRWLGFEK